MVGMTRLAKGAAIAVGVSLAVFFTLLVFLLVRLLHSCLRDKIHPRSEDVEAKATSEQSSQPLTFSVYCRGVETGGEGDGNGDNGTPYVTPESSPSYFKDHEDLTGYIRSPDLKPMATLPALLPPMSSSTATYMFERQPFDSFSFQGRQSLAESTEAFRSSSSSFNYLRSSPTW